MARDDDSQLVEFLLQANRLKTTPRTGWAMRGVPAPESVADHSHGVAQIALLLSEPMAASREQPQGKPLDRQKLLAMAILHDLVESVTGDLSLGASRHLPAGAKARGEQSALAELLAGAPFADRWSQLCREFEEQQSPEARLVRDADRLDLLTQALVYERTTGNRDLHDFWHFAPPDSFSHELSRELATQLHERHKKMG